MKYAILGGAIGFVGSWAVVWVLGSFIAWDVKWMANIPTWKSEIRLLFTLVIVTTLGIAAAGAAIGTDAGDRIRRRNGGM